MAHKHSYTITVDNNKTEKEAINLLLESELNFFNPDKESRKKIMEMLSIEKKFSRAFDLLLIPGHSNLEKALDVKIDDAITLIELKTTKKKLINMPSGFFFGATESELELAKILGSRFKFCFVSLHAESKPAYCLLTLEELNAKIKTKRIQYQINI